MRRHPSRSAAAAGLLVAALSGLSGARPAAAEVAVGADGRLKLFGDFRFRAEADRDSTQPDGLERPDRDRLRVRLRLGFSFAFDEHFRFGGRLRSGNPQDQQSPHQTLGDEFEPKSINIDRAFLQAEGKPGWVWAGKNAFPFWTQNELFWDDDVAPEGLAAGSQVALGKGPLRLRPTIGYFLLEPAASSNRLGDKSELAAVQVALDAGLAAADLTLAAGFYAFRENPAVPDTALADLDYSLWVLGARAVLKKPRRPWTVGVDFMRNAEDYPATVWNADQRTGYVLSASWGSLKSRNDWLLGYYYAHVEKYAVVARLAQDDWHRWGSTTDTRSSNFKGHELRAAYAVRPSWNVMLRVFLVDGLRRESPSAVALEDGTRARLDFNLAF
jgi:hypothetical protein